MLGHGLAATPGHLAGRVLKGRIAAGTGQLDEARRDLSEVLARFPEHYDALQALAGVERLAGRAEAERDALEQLREVSPEPWVLARIAELDADPGARPRMPPPRRRTPAAMTRPSAVVPGDDEAAEARARTIPAGPAARPGMVVPPVGAPPEGGPDPFSNATMAELLASQGDLDGALAMYRGLLAREPGRRSLRQRFIELGGPPSELPEVVRPEEPEPAALERSLRDLVEGS